MASSKRKQGKSLSSGRPPTAQKPKATLSASATRTLIRSHHRLHKELYKASSIGDTLKVESIQHKIDELGGLQSYQQASILGQSKDRGGDSSIVLVQWLQRECPGIKSLVPTPRLLEVGALATTNACSRSGLFSIERIDLESQGEGILCQDFMERPLPVQDSEHFDIISLSLVLNYVPDAVQRGEMLKRTRRFLRTCSDKPAYFPLLFVVLPAPCLANSRYLDDSRFTAIMTALGYQRVAHKQSSKLVYTLWHLTGMISGARFPKVEVNPGHQRNNFTIILEND